MKILITGDRNWTDTQIIWNALCSYHSGSDAIELIHGAARGADTIGSVLAKVLDWKVTPERAKWHIYGRPAGAIRNRVMLDKQPDVVLAFHDNLYTGSRGTKDCVDEAIKRGIPVILYTTWGNPEELSQKPT